MKPEEIKQLKEIKDFLSKKMEILEKLVEKKEPREFWMYYHDYARQWRSIEASEAMNLADSIEIIHVREVINE